MIQVPERRIDESELDYLRRKQEMFGYWQSEALERINDLEAECAALREDKVRRVMALNATRNILNTVSDMILKENFDMPMDTFTKDYAPFINVMAHHGIIEGKPKKRRSA